MRCRARLRAEPPPPTPGPRQRVFEERLERQLAALDARLARRLGELDASIRQAVDALLGQRFGALREAQEASHGRLETDLRDVATAVGKLGSALDSLSAGALRPLQRERPGASSR